MDIRRRVLFNLLGSMNKYHQLLSIEGYTSTKNVSISVDYNEDDDYSSYAKDYSIYSSTVLPSLGNYSEVVLYANMDYSETSNNYGGFSSSPYVDIVLFGVKFSNYIYGRSYFLIKSSLCDDNTQFIEVVDTYGFEDHGILAFSNKLGVATNLSSTPISINSYITVTPSSTGARGSVTCDNLDILIYAR